MIFLLQFILIAIFLIVSLQKIMGNQQQIDIFNDLKISQRLRVLTGWIELIGVVGLVIGFWSSWVVVIAGLWFAVIMLIAMIAHIRVKDPLGKCLPAFILLIVSVLLVIFQLQSILS